MVISHKNALADVAKMFGDSFVWLRNVYLITQIKEETAKDEELLSLCSMITQGQDQIA